ncbi:kelch repeat-containing protein [Dokdonella sp.]|uniref:Kelch repeat-containing protein n=1 Tax=Dokdonella sp. TaxID=2291710 RepID=UPI001B167982|nr:kelch repeat-containing protein [Dokdonella sp.]MBO9662134.1 hypothetical protein [Dokdonella sp.]
MPSSVSSAAFAAVRRFVLPALFALAPIAASAEFVVTGNLVTARTSPTATTLLDGRVLITGGNVRTVDRAPAATAEVFDPASGQFSATGAMTVPRWDHAATLLHDGRVLVVGGSSGADDNGISFTQANGELYDPASGTFSAVPSAIEVGGERTTVTTLADGRALVVSGWIQGQGTVARAQLFDPASDTFSETGAPHFSRIVHTATLLADGRVLVVGGTSSTEGLLDNAELYDPATGTFTLLASTMSTSRERHAAARLADGRVLITGGYGPEEMLDVSELFDPATASFVPSQATMALARVDFNLLALPDGKVFALGSNQWGIEAGTAELYDPAADAFSLISPGPSTERDGARTALLADGRVLIAAGVDLRSENADLVTYGEIYAPGAADAIFADGFEGAP